MTLESADFCKLWIPSDIGWMRLRRNNVSKSGVAKNNVYIYMYDDDDDDD
jgi:hypothetical protein